MRRKNIFVHFVGVLARKFRVLQETWILPWWGNGKLIAIPFWALDSLVLVLKLCSTCVMACVKILIPSTAKSLHGETVLITGAGSGLGRELALQLAELGATIICWDKDAQRNKAVVEEIRKKDGDSFGFTLDVSVREQVASIANCMRRLADVSVVISNAGTLQYGPFTHLRSEAIAKMIEVNLLAHFWIIQAFLPSMIERRRGHIVAINSSAGLMPCGEMLPYCAAKYGLRGLMESISEELRLDSWTKNIYTTSVYLGTMSNGLYPAPSHRFVSWYSEISPKDAAKIIINGIRKNKKTISIPSYMKFLIDLYNLMPYRIRIILTDFFNFGHRVRYGSGGIISTYAIGLICSATKLPLRDWFYALLHVPRDDEPLVIKCTMRIASPTLPPSAQYPFWFLLHDVERYSSIIRHLGLGENVY